MSGEELTFDYNSVTESQEEYAAAVCLCGSQSCRGSFLGFAHSTAFKNFLENEHTTLERVSLLLEASQTLPLTAEESAMLDKYGFRGSLLGTLPFFQGAQIECPRWLKVGNAMLDVGGDIPTPAQIDFANHNECCVEICSRSAAGPGDGRTVSTGAPV